LRLSRKIYPDWATLRNTEIVSAAACFHAHWGPSRAVIVGVSMHAARPNQSWAQGARPRPRTFNPNPKQLLACPCISTPGAPLKSSKSVDNLTTLEPPSPVPASVAAACRRLPRLCQLVFDPLIRSRQLGSDEPHGLLLCSNTGKKRDKLHRNPTLGFGPGFHMVIPGHRRRRVESRLASTIS
jgi:hypothetical protein